MECENKKNNPYCDGRIKGKTNVINNMEVCSRCFWKIKRENKNK